MGRAPFAKGFPMPSPFPGMDPYLESAELCPDVHHGLIGGIQAYLNPLLRPRYVARVELRVYIADEDDAGRAAFVPDVRVETTSKRRGKKTRPAESLILAEPLTVPWLVDDEIKEARLEIVDVSSKALVTVIEVLSPTNKIPGARGRQSFMDKRREVLGSDSHWVEIDLLRRGLSSVTHPPLVPSAYRILVSRAGDRSRAHDWPIGIRERLPVIGIPLGGSDPDVPLDLSAVFSQLYDQAAYDLSLDYRRVPNPPLEGEDANWACRLLRESRSTGGR